MITAVRTELTKHGLHPEYAHPTALRRHRGRAVRELYTGPELRRWFREVLPGLQSTEYSTGYSPREEAANILSRFAAGARLYVEPDEQKPGDIKLLDPPTNWVWELKTGDVRIFGWFHAHDCFVAYTGDDATNIKDNCLYGRHIADALDFLARVGLEPREGDHHRVLTL